jgi:hypothetical protein
MPRIALAPAVVALVLVFTGAAAAAPELDQQQILIEPGINLVVGGPYNQRLAQIVLPGIAGLVSEVQVPVSCNASSTLLVEIRNSAGVPGSTVLASRSIPGASLPPQGPTFVPVTFPTPAFVAVDEPFAIVLSATGPGCGAYVGPRNVDTYPRGNAYASYLPDEQWRGGASSDLAFKTFVDRRCRVPTLVGTPLEEAGMLVTRNGCAAGPLRRAFSKTVPSGTVISQSPSEGTQLAAGSAVSIVVSRGPRPCVVPKLRGKTLKQARASLTRSNCRLGKIARRSVRGARPGRVSSQRPAPGARRPAGTRVQVVVSR